jgi:hypothetical protein
MPVIKGGEGAGFHLKQGGQLTVANACQPGGGSLRPQRSR